MQVSISCSFYENQVFLNSWHIISTTKVFVSSSNTVTCPVFPDSGITTKKKTSQGHLGWKADRLPKDQ